MQKVVLVHTARGKPTNIAHAQSKLMGEVLTGLRVDPKIVSSLEDNGQEPDTIAAINAAGRLGTLDAAGRASFRFIPHT